MSIDCDYYKNHICRSCGWIELSLDAQILKKETLARETLGVGLETTVRSRELGFRNKAKMSVTGSFETPIIGLTGIDSLDEGRELLSCPVHHPKINELLAILPDFIREYRLHPYQIKERTGELKGLILFYGEESDEMVLRFILRSKECVSRITKLLPVLIAKFPELKCVSANIQPVPHAILEGKDEIVLTDQRVITHRLGGMDLILTPQAFVQTNVSVAVKLYQTAAAWISEIENSNSKKMLELFSGQGAFSFFSARSIAHILGIEISEGAVAIANQTAEKLKYPHVHFKALNVEKSLDQEVSRIISNFKPDVILANPPRRGLGESVLWIKNFLPDDFFYSSCALPSLSSDLDQLKSHYEIKRVQIFDLFPHTEHFETLVWLKRIKP